MSERTLTCAAMPLRADQSAYALVIGTREGMARLLGGQTEKLERRIDPAEWALKTETQCVIGDESASVALAADNADDPQTLAGQIVRLLRLRYQKGLPGWTLLPCAPMLHNGKHLAEAMIACAVQWKLPAAFLRWLISENAGCATMTDCAQWLIET